LLILSLKIINSSKTKKMNSDVNHREKGTINVRDEKEFKLWMKFIVSIHKEGGDIRKPIDILWRSIESELKPLSSCKHRKKEVILS
jgi:hypothetical protein